MIREECLEIREFSGPGYMPVVDFETWRVAILNYIDENHPAEINMMERHNETDEVFVLIKGRAILFLGEGKAQVENIQTQVLQSGKIYNVKRGIWHTVALSLDASVLIVENQNTRKENSDYFPFVEAQKQFILKTARQEQPDCWR